MAEKKLKAGDSVETIHGEKLKVIKVEEVGAITKKGVVIQEGSMRVLAESGGHPTWFAASKLK